MGGARLIACLAALLLVPPAAAQAAYPGTNGKLAFVRDGHIWTMNADGTGAAQLTTGTADASDPEWSPDGTRIAFVRNLNFPPERRLFTIKADGTGEAPFPVFIPDQPGEVYAPTWSPDGRRLAYILSYEDNENCFCRLWEMRSDFADHFSLFALNGAQWSPSGATIALSEDDDESVERIRKFSVASGAAAGGIGNGPLRDFGPAWSPDATKVAYISRRADVASCDGPDPACRHEVQVANAGNTEITRLTVNGAAEYDVEWAPDGSKLVYSGVEPGCTSCSGPDLHVMNPDGTGRVRITNTAAGEFQPDWQPVVSGQGPGYPRPAGAAPLRVSLVPTYASCTAPNREHGPPLAFGSCNPPALRSSNLTVGTPDANGAVANMMGWLKFRVLNPGPTPPDDAELSITASIDDVRCQRPDIPHPCSSQGNTHPTPDYVGRLTARVPLRLTDRYNLPSPGGRGAGTMTATVFDMRIDCSPTASTSIGSTCALTTTGNAIIPGLVVEGRRSVWQLGDVLVFDGGPGGASDPDGSATPFLRQGIFVP
jgi:Tol biopolymer transport system component